MLALRVGALVTDGLSDDIWLGLLVDDEALSLLERRKSLLLNTVHQVVACGDVVDETNDLACGPYLQCCQYAFAVVESP